MRKPAHEQSPTGNLPMQILSIALLCFLSGLLVAAAYPGIFSLVQGGR